MKIQIQKLFLAAAVALGGAPVFAHDGVINISGNILNQTCRLKTGNDTITVKLPDVSSVSLSSVNKTAGITPFTITLENCQAGDRSVSVYFEPGTNTNGSRLKNAASNNKANNVEIQLLNKDRNPIDLAKNSADGQSSTSISPTTSDNHLNYYAQYYATGDVTAGAVSTSVNYTIVYN